MPMTNLMPGLNPPPDAGRRKLVDEFGRPLDDDDGFLLPHYRTFAAVYNAFNRVYRYTWDEASKDSEQNSEAMWRDGFIQACLQERAAPVVTMPWHLEPPNPRDPAQKQIADGLKAAIEETPLRHQQWEYLLRGGTWFGRYGSQVKRGVRDVGGVERSVITGHVPVHGDKIAFDWDGNPLVSVSAMFAADLKGRDPAAADKLLAQRDDRGGIVTYGDRSPLLRLSSPQWRERFVIYQHELEDANYFHGEMAGAVAGVGLRHRVYWLNWMRMECTAWLLSYMEKVGANGLLLFFYPESNAAAKVQAESAAASSSTKTAFAVPVPAGSTKAQVGGEMIPASTGGTDALRGVIADYFERHIERLIVGQSMSAGADDESGLGGSGRADFAKQTKHYIIKSDAAKFAEILTRDLVKPALRRNFPGVTIPVKLVFDIPDPERKEKLEAAKATIQVAKLPVKVDEWYALSGLTKPTADDEVIDPAAMTPPPDVGQGLNNPDAAAAVAADQEGDDSPPGDSGDDADADSVGYQFDEGKVHRGQPKNAGQFGPGGGPKSEGRQGHRPRGRCSRTGRSGEEAGAGVPPGQRPRVGRDRAADDGAGVQRP